MRKLALPIFFLFCVIHSFAQVTVVDPRTFPSDTTLEDTDETYGRPTGTNKRYLMKYIRKYVRSGFSGHISVNAVSGAVTIQSDVIAWAMLASATKDSIITGKKRVSLRSSKPSTTYIADIVVDTVGTDTIYIWNTSVYSRFNVGGGSGTIADGSITNAKLATNAVDSTKAANLSPNNLSQTLANINDVLTWTGSKYAPRAVSTATLNSVIKASPIFKNTIYQDSILVPAVNGATTNGLFQITPLDSTEHSAPFLFGTSATKYATGTNHVMYMGWNLEPGGGQRKANYPAIGEGWENRWRPDGFIDYTEKHEVWATGDDTLRRISSWTLDNVSKEGGIYYLANRFSIRRKHQSNSDHFIIQGDARPGALGSSLSLANGYGTFSLAYEKTAGSSSNSLAITNNYNTANTSQFNISGFTNANFPFSVISMPTSSYFAYNDGTILQNSSGFFRVLTNGTKSFYHQTPVGTPFESWCDGVAAGVNIGADVGTYNRSLALSIGGTNKGVRLPRMTDAQRNAITPVESMFFYNITDSLFQYHDGLRYRPLSWGYKGNYVRAIDFIGSTNNADVIFKRNAVENMRLTANGASIGRTSAGGVTNNNPNLRLFQKAGGQFPYAGISIDHENTTLTGNEGGSFINFTRRDSTQAAINYDYLELGDTRAIGSLKISNSKNGAIRFQTNGLDRQYIKGDGKIGIGTIYPGAKLTINQNTSFISPGNDPVIAGTSLLLIGANSTPANIQVTSVDTFSRILFTNQNGTFGGGVPTKGAQTLAAISFSGSDNFGYTPIYDLFRTKAVSSWTSTNRPYYTEMYATAPSSTTQTKSIVVEHNGLRVVSGTIWLNDAKTVGIFTGTGSPEGAVTASVGSTFHRTDGGALSSFYVKESGNGNTGWVFK